MPTKKKASGIRRRASGKSSATTIASMEKQIAALEEQIALLQQASGIRLQTSGIRIQDSGIRLQTSGKNDKANPEARSPKPEALNEARAQLETPVITSVSVTADSFTVTWSEVPNAVNYRLYYADDPAFSSGMDSVLSSGATTTVTVNDRAAGTTYYVRVIANAAFGGGYTGSAFSDTQTVRTLSFATNGETPEGNINTATELQNWLDEQQTLLQSFSTLVPEIENTVLMPSERRRLLGSGVRRYGFIDKVSDSAVAYPQFWPDYASDGEERLKTLIREIEVLRNLLVFYESGARTMQDLLLIKGDEALRLATTYYVTVREAARRGVPNAEALFQLLRLFWKRRRNTSAEPTIPEVERDMRALLRGTKDGEIIVRNESDRVVKGEKVMIDNTQKAQSSKFKEQSEGEVE